ncbi:MAG: tRNA lysidine(34) synthetase TilS [Desulfobacteraceae bacterium]|nr:MAG: tRNA lysidine(34) synthetase TilS [Desulfobacteraceae bacterium]
MLSFGKKSYNRLIKKVEKTLSEYYMLKENDSVLVGVSGGADSVALIHILKEISLLFSLKLGVAHLNHSLRGNESDNDALFVASVSDKLHLPCFVEKKDVIKYKTENGLSIEEAGRLVRYAFFEDIAEKKGYNRIALGHTCDDNAELVLMYLLRGSGPLGLSGIPPVRPGTKSNISIIRPLIKTGRKELIDYISEKNLSYITDQSNLDEKYLRNRVRNRLIPELKDGYNPKIVETLNRLSSIVRSEEEWMENELKFILDKNTLVKEDNRIVLSVSGMNALHPAAKKRAIRSAVAGVKGDLRRISYSHTELVSVQLEGNSYKWNLDLPDRIRVSRTGSSLVVSKEKNSLRSIVSKSGISDRLNFEYVINEPCRVNAEKEGFKVLFSEIMNISLEDISKSASGVAFFDMDTISFPLVLRNCLPGDRFTPLGMTGSKKVSKYLINKKVPGESRLKLPVLLSSGRIIWLAGHVIDDSVKVTLNTRKILKAELFLA